jgi:hypothetical protein
VILSLSLLLLLGAWWSIGQGRFYLTTHSSKLYDANVLWLSQGSEVEQEFVADYPGLSQVDVFVKWQSNPPDKAVINFYLRKSCAAENNLHAQETLYPTGEIDGRAFYSFSFPPLVESLNQKYCFILKSGLPDDQKNLMGVLASNTDIYPEGRAFYHRPPPLKTGSEAGSASTLPDSSSAEYRLFLPIVLVPLPNENMDIAFQLHYEGWHLETAQVFFMRLAENKFYFWGSPSFYIILGIVYFSSAAIFIGLALHESRIGKS